MNIIRVWRDRSIRFRNDGEEVCLTDIANACGKLTGDWLRQKSTSEYLNAFCSVAGIPITEALQVVQGGIPEEQGTWAHRRVAIRFAQWCSPELAVMVDTWVDEMLLAGKVEIGQFAGQSKSMLDVAYFALDNIFANVNLKPELLAGLKLNATLELMPQLATSIEPSRQLLINSTAQEFQLLTPSEIGNRLGISAQKVNQKLIEKGLQVKNSSKKSKKEPSYLPTDRGQEFADLTLSTGKGGDSSTYQQLRWYESVLNFLD